MSKAEMKEEVRVEFEEQIRRIDARGESQEDWRRESLINFGRMFGEEWQEKFRRREE